MVYGGMTCTISAVAELLVIEMSLFLLALLLTSAFAVEWFCERETQNLLSNEETVQ